MIALYTVKPGMYLIAQSRAPVGLLPNFGYISRNRHNQTAASQDPRRTIARISAAEPPN